MEVKVEGWEEGERATSAKALCAVSGRGESEWWSGRVNFQELRGATEAVGMHLGDWGRGVDIVLLGKPVTKLHIILQKDTLLLFHTCGCWSLGHRGHSSA